MYLDYSFWLKLQSEFFVLKYIFENNSGEMVLHEKVEVFITLSSVRVIYLKIFHGISFIKHCFLDIFNPHYVKSFR